MNQPDTPESTAAAPHPHRTRRLVILLAAIALVFVGVVGFNVFKDRAIRKFAAANALQPATVSTTIARREPWQPQTSAVGSLRAVRGIDVTSEVGGLVREVHFASGQQVAAGTLLVQLNADADIATLHAMQAAAELAASVLERDRAAVRGTGDQQGATRCRLGRPEEPAGAGAGAAGADRQEEHPRAVRRPARHLEHRRRAVHRAGRQDRAACRRSTRSWSTSTCRSSSSTGSRRGSASC